MLDYLKHYGVKGMRWGVRKDKRAQSRIDKNYLISKGKSFAYEYGDDVITAVIQSAAIASGMGFTTPLIAFSISVVDTNVKNRVKR